MWASSRPNQPDRPSLHSRRIPACERLAAPRDVMTMANAQFVASVLMRLGTSPTGMTALTVLLSVSMAVTDLMAAFEI
jgi:hypothetical protein